MEYYAVITAGGVGKRMKARVPKQFLELDGKPILLRTLELFSGLDVPVKIVLVLPSSHIEEWKETYNRSGSTVPHAIVAGGLTRFHSVRAALETIPDGAVVAVHDGVRPIVPQDLLNRLLTYPPTDECSGVIPVLNIVESMRRKKYSESGEVVGTNPVTREDYLLVQTPQVFDSTRLKLAYKKPYSPSFTDDASVMESSGYSFDTIEGSRSNIKITNPEDLAFATRLLSSV